MLPQKQASCSDLQLELETKQSGYGKRGQNNTHLKQNKRHDKEPIHIQLQASAHQSLSIHYREWYGALSAESRNSNEIIGKPLGQAHAARQTLSKVILEARTNL